MSKLNKSVVFLALVMAAVAVSGVTFAQSSKPEPPSRLGPPNFGPTTQGTGCVGATVTDLHVSLLIQHTWVGDLDITLSAPSAGPVMIVSQVGDPVPFGGLGCSGDDIDAILFDGAAGGSVENQCDPNVPTVGPGNFTPSPGTMAPFDGQTLNGVWSLAITDTVGGDSGQLRTWCLAEADGPTCCTSPMAPLGDLETTTSTFDLDATGDDTGDGTTTPAVGTWGILAMISLLLAASLFHFRRRAEQV